MARPGPKPIQDPFTALPVSRSYRSQLRNRAHGLCQCGQPILPGSVSQCKRCLERRMIYARIRRASRKGQE